MRGVVQGVDSSEVERYNKSMIKLMLNTHNQKTPQSHYQIFFIGVYFANKGFLRAEAYKTPLNFLDQPSRQNKPPYRANLRWGRKAFLRGQDWVAGKPAVSTPNALLPVLNKIRVRVGRMYVGSLNSSPSHLATAVAKAGRSLTRPVYGSVRYCISSPLNFMEVNNG